METGQSKQLHVSSSFPDRNSSIDHSSNITRQMGYIHRLEGCILPHSSRTPSQEVPTLPGRRPALPIQSSTVRPGDVPIRIHKNNESSRKLRPLSRATVVPIFGRLATIVQQLDRSNCLDPVAAQAGQGTGFDPKHSQVRSDPIPDLPFHRGTIQSDPGYSSTSCPQSHGLHSTGNLDSAGSISYCGDLPVSARPHDITGETGT